MFLARTLLKISRGRCKHFTGIHSIILPQDNVSDVTDCINIGLIHFHIHVVVCVCVYVSSSCYIYHLVRIVLSVTVVYTGNYTVCVHVSCLLSCIYIYIYIYIIFGCMFCSVPIKKFIASLVGLCVLFSQSSRQCPPILYSVLVWHIVHVFLPWMSFRFFPVSPVTFDRRLFSVSSAEVIMFCDISTGRVY